MLSNAGGAIINIFTLIEKPVYRLIKKSNNNNNNHTRAYTGDYITRVCKCRCQLKLIVTIKKPKNYWKKLQSTIAEEGKRLFVASSTHAHTRTPCTHTSSDAIYPKTGPQLSHPSLNVNWRGQLKCKP